jgi:hypothetical protein
VTAQSLGLPATKNLMTLKYDPQLIYDVGMNNGDDTAYYLQRGFRVLAIEANSDLVANAATRFAREIGTRRLMLALQLKRVCLRFGYAVDRRLAS